MSILHQVGRDNYELEMEKKQIVMQRDKFLQKVFDQFTKNAGTCTNNYKYRIGDDNKLLHTIDINNPNITRVTNGGFWGYSYEFYDSNSGYGPSEPYPDPGWSPLPGSIPTIDTYGKPTTYSLHNNLTFSYSTAKPSNPTKALKLNLFQKPTTTPIDIRNENFENEYDLTPFLLLETDHAKFTVKLITLWVDRSYMGKTEEMQPTIDDEYKNCKLNAEGELTKVIKSLSSNDINVIGHLAEGYHCRYNCRHGMAAEYNAYLFGNEQLKWFREYSQYAYTSIGVDNLPFASSMCMLGLKIRFFIRYGTITETITIKLCDLVGDVTVKGKNSWLDILQPKVATVIPIMISNPRGTGSTANKSMLWFFRDTKSKHTLNISERQYDGKILPIIRDTFTGIALEKGVDTVL